MDGIKPSDDSKDAKKRRRSHRIRDMHLVGTERDLAAVLGKAIVVRLSPQAREDVLDRILQDLRNKVLEEEVLETVEDYGVSYDAEKGRERQHIKDTALTEFLKKRSHQPDASRPTVGA